MTIGLREEKFLVVQMQSFLAWRYRPKLICLKCGHDGQCFEKFGYFEWGWASSKRGPSPMKDCVSMKLA